jgi:diguanylate cyclase (GGDEF)-like protein
VAVAGILQEALRDCDLVFRYGGEDFIAILPETGIKEALVAAERSRQAVALRSATCLQPAVFQGVTVSVGVASYPRDGGDSDALLQVTDELLYMAKKQGKNKIYHHSVSE